jgi:hypothetical protein
LFALASTLLGSRSITKADEWDKTTKITFREPVQVPGKVLDPGTYVFRLMESQANRHIVQIFNEDHTSLITTVLAIPNQRLEPTGKTVLMYDERPADQPVALAAWFYPGDNMGQEFVYPKSEAAELSRLNKREVPSTESDEAYPGGKSEERSAAYSAEQSTPTQQTETTQPEPTPAPQPSTSTAESTPTPAPTPAPETNTTPTPAPETRAQSAPPANPPTTYERKLPQTASALPLVGLLSLTLLGAATLLRLALRS